MFINDKKRERLIYIELPKLLLEILLESKDLPIDMKMVDFTIDEIDKVYKAFINSHYETIKSLSKITD